MASIEKDDYNLNDSLAKLPKLSESMKKDFQAPNTIGYQRKDATSEYIVSFSSNSENYCVGMVDMVGSTKISAILGPKKSSRYYQIFINSMSQVLHNFGGYVIKNIGDCVLFYFPHIIERNSKYSMIACLECGLEMIEFRKILCKKLKQEGLPCLDYRISADFGSVTIMKSNNSSVTDMIGSPVNMCSKINKLAPKNGFVIGGDLHERIKKFQEYQFKEKEGYNIGFRYQYPVYEVIRK